MSAGRSHNTDQASLPDNEPELTAFLNTSNASTIENTVTTPFISRTMMENVAQREQLVRNEADMNNSEMALLLNLENMRNARLGTNLLTSYNDSNPLVNDYNETLVQQYMLQRRRQQQQQQLQQRQQQQHQEQQQQHQTLEQLLLTQRLQQLQHQTGIVSHQLYGVSNTNPYIRMNPYSSVAAMQNNSIGSIPRSYLNITDTYQEHLLEALLRNQTDSTSSLPVPGRSTGGISSLPRLNPRSELLSDPDLLYMQQNLQRQTTTEFQEINSMAERVHMEASSPTKIDNSPAAKQVVEEPTPVRALSAYNFFFRYERERILNSDGDDDSGMDILQLSQDALLQAHWNRDRTVKRRHRKSHGKISFADLSKKISKRWKQLSAEEKNFFTEVASKDWERYHRELEQRKGDEKFPFKKDH